MKYSAFDRLILRTPLHSFNTLDHVLKAENSDLATERLVEFFSKDINNEALFVASPSLWRAFSKYQDEGIKDQEKYRSLTLSLLKYFCRMATRATPFGLLAGFNVCKIGRETDVLLEPPTAVKRHTKLDMHYLCALAKNIASQPEIRRQLSFYPNTSLYEVGNSYRYIERKHRNSGFTYHISEVEKEEFIKKIMQHAVEGQTISSLSHLLIDDDISYEEAEEFVFHLVDEQLLVSQLEPSVSGQGFFTDVFKILQKLDPTTKISLSNTECTLQEYIRGLSRINNKLEELDNKGTNTVSSYYEAAHTLDDLDVEYDMKTLFQVDLEKSALKRKIDASILTNVRQCLKLFNKLRATPRNARLEEFTKTCFSRYENREMPLMHVLDPELGIGYPPASKNLSKGTLKWDAVQSLLHDKVLDALCNRSSTIELKDSDVLEFQEDWSDYPNTFSCMFSVLQKGEQPVVHVTAAGNPSAVEVIGRFCYANEEVLSLAKQITKKESEYVSEDTVYAEINHITEARTGNILSRPHLRYYEIPFLTSSSLSEEQWIRLSDMMLSVQGDKIVLRSSKLNKIVIPKLSNAHNINVGATQPVYQFLGDLRSGYGYNTVGFSWGALEEMFEFLPRVLYKSNIVARARWKIKQIDYKNILEAKVSERKYKLDQWRKEHKIPDQVVLVEYDNELFIDFTNSLSIQTFFSVVKNKNFIRLEEFIYNEYGSLVKDTSGNRYANQLVASFYKKNTKEGNKQAASTLQSISATEIKRDFIPGDEWVYFKLYCGAKSSNGILIDLIEPLVKYLENKNIIDKWFFVRYTDPEYHIRIRFHASSLNKVSSIFRIFYSSITPFHSMGVIQKLVFDTYSRELERYGFDAMPLAEDYFYYNSRFVLLMIDQIQDDAKVLVLTIRYLDRFLEAFGFNLQTKEEFFSKLAEGFGKEFQMDSVLRREIGQRFRADRNRIETALVNQSVGVPEIYSHIDKNIFDLSSTIKAVTKLYGEKNDVLNDILSSYVHMFLNRVHVDNWRYKEMILYHMAWHHYRSQIAKATYVST